MLLQNNFSLSGLFLLFFGIFLPVSAQNEEAYFTRPLQPEIRSLQVIPNSAWGELPVLRLGSSDYIDVSFDRTHTVDAERFRYKLIQCNADWTPSALLDVECFDGFNDNLVEDYACSKNTTVDYVHYHVRIPNQNIQVKLSGNYVLQVYEEDDPSKLVLTACFYVVDKQVDVASGVNSNTDLGLNSNYQQVSFRINQANLSLRDPYTEIKTAVLQNRRRDNMKFDVKPTFLNGNNLVYEHNRALIFEAGNEYRRFEFVNTGSGGMNVEKFRYENREYVAWITSDKIRADKSYLYDQDQDGLFLIRNTGGADPRIDADYIHVNFELKSDLPLNQGVYLFGDCTYSQFSPSTEMIFDEQAHSYHQSLLLKQGAYNYMYLTEKDGVGETGIVEGNCYQTENEYLVLVYYRPIGKRYDALIGYSIVKSQ